MPIFRRAEEEPRERTAEERERARAERAARRASRTGDVDDLPAPPVEEPRAVAPPAHVPPPEPAPTAEPAIEAEAPAEPAWEPEEPAVAEPPVAAEAPSDDPVWEQEEPAAAEPAVAAEAPSDDHVWEPEEPAVAEPPVAAEAPAAEPAWEPEEPKAAEPPVAAENPADDDLWRPEEQPPFAGHPAEHGFAGPPEAHDDAQPTEHFEVPVSSGEEQVQHAAPAAEARPAEDPPAGSPAPQETVAFDVLSERDEDVADPEPSTADRSWFDEDPDEEPRVSRLERVEAGAPAPRTGRADVPVPPAIARRRAGAASVARFGDEEERPAPVKRVTAKERRSLPPTPPPPGAPAHTRRRRRRLRIAGLFALILILGLAYLVNMIFQPFHGDGDARVTVRIPTNSTAADVGDALAEKGIVDSGFLFMVRARLSGADLQAGSYSLPRDASYSAAIDALSKGPEAAPTINVGIPEGRSRREAAPLVEEAGLTGSYLKATEDAPKGFNPRRYGAPKRLESLEGFLFPATYELKPRASAKSLVAKQLDSFEENVAEVDMRTARRRNLTTYDVLIIASMVEREATLARERPVIAAVIHNRLRQGMPLGIDATIRFATRNWTEPLKQSELEIDSPYNTRENTGLPPGPIGSPGADSIRAAANPAKVDFLFYVVKPGTCGEHAFSSTDAEFQRDVDAYNGAREAAGGKSPTNC